MPDPITGPVEDKYLVGSSFTLEIPGIAPIKDISDVSGLSLEVNVVEYKQAGAKGEMVVKKTVGAPKFSEVVVKRKFTADKSMWDYMVGIRDGKNAKYRADGAIVMFDFGNKEMGRWTFSNAFPSKWSLSDLDVSGDDPITEELTIQIETIKRDS